MTKQYKNLPVRLEVAEYEAIKEAATDDKLKVSTWLRQLALRAIDERNRVDNKTMNGTSSTENKQ